MVPLHIRRLKFRPRGPQRVAVFGDQTSEVKGFQGQAPSRGSREGSFLPLPVPGGRQASLGWWPCPSSLCLCLHVALPPVCRYLQPPCSFRGHGLGFRALPESPGRAPPLKVLPCEDLGPKKVTFTGSECYSVSMFWGGWSHI